MSLVIQSARIIDPSQGLDQVLDLKIEDGKIAALGENLDPQGSDILEAEGLILAPGLVDVHVHFRDPGFTQKEDLETGARAAARGGYTAVICMANTQPVINTVEDVKAFQARAQESPIRLYTVAALTKDLKGRELNDLEALAQTGIPAFSDDGFPLKNENLFKEALLRTKKLGLPISLHEEDPDLIDRPGFDAGPFARDLGIQGAPVESEVRMVERDCQLALETGGAIDIQHLSSGQAAKIIARYKEMGAPVVCEVTPHHFSLTREALKDHGSLAKMNPPLRSQEEKDLLLDHIARGTIDFIATDHAPHTMEEKNKPILEAPSGILGLETALSLAIQHLVKPGLIDYSRLIDLMSTKPARYFRLEGGTLRVGHPADLVLFDPEATWSYDHSLSKSQNSPFLGDLLPGKVFYTFCRGKLIFKE